LLDIQQLIKTAIEKNWSISYPSIAEFLIKLDEMDPKWGYITEGGFELGKFEQPMFESWGIETSLILQVILENFPDRKTYIADTSSGKCYRVEHGCKITIYLKPTSYTLEKIEDFKTIFNNIKSEIDRILALKKFTVYQNLPLAQITNLEMTMQGWDDGDTIAVGRGVKTKKEPIMWKSERTVTAIYFIFG